MKSFFWEDYPDENLLDLTIRELRLRLATGDIGPWVERGLKDFDAAGIKLKPDLYLGDEWFTADGSVAIAIPFFVAHPRLRRLERQQMGDCEGGDEESFLRIFRHEMGHVFDHVHRLSFLREWRDLFGSRSKRYDPDFYVFDRWSTAFVHNIEDFYSQAHPLEDFAETFAVCVDPHSEWRTRYRRWKCYPKLVFVDELIQFYGPRLPRKNPYTARSFEAARLKTTLRSYYEKKRRYKKKLDRLHASI